MIDLSFDLQMTDHMNIRWLLYVLLSDIEWPTRKKQENANWRSLWPLLMMLENIPFLSRIHMEKSQHLSACWRKVFTHLLGLHSGHFIFLWFQLYPQKAFSTDSLLFLHTHLQSNMTPIWSSMMWCIKLKWRPQWFRSPQWLWVSMRWNRRG